MDYARKAGAKGIGLTFAALEAHGPEYLARLAAERGLFISSLNSAGYFICGGPALCARQRELNKRLIDAAARMRAGRLVVIVGGIAEMGLTLEAARLKFGESLVYLDAEAQSAGVWLALEPIHPADLMSKGCINSIQSALNVVRNLPATDIVIDTFHSGWDHDIWIKAVLCNPKLALVQMCDWVEPSPDEKSQREVPGRGYMDLKGWLSSVKSRDYAGPIEYEMFDRHRRGRDVKVIMTEALGFLREAIGP